MEQKNATSRPHAYGSTQLTVARYVTASGEPTCAANFETGEVCRFYATQRLGCGETCLFADKSGGKYWEALRRRDGGNGTLIPLKTCPVWAPTVAGADKPSEGVGAAAP